MTITEGDVSAWKPQEDESLCLLEVPNPIILVPGTYKVMFSIDGPLEEIGEFRARSASDAEIQSQGSLVTRNLA